MKIIVGLGNPGKKYQNNRHNAGHMFIDYLVKESKRLKIKDDGLRILKTDCFMNQSGQFVKRQSSLIHDLSSQLWIVHDDLDIPLGKFKIDQGTGPKVHNGLTSIEQTLGTKDFWRIRIGVDKRKQDNWIDGETYVLQDFLTEEKTILHQTFPRIVTLLQNEYKLL